MIQLNLVPVKRCCDCHRLVPANSEHCPYCHGNGFSLKVNDAPKPVVKEHDEKVAGSSVPVPSVKSRVVIKRVFKRLLWIVLGVIATFVIIGICSALFSPGGNDNEANGTEYTNTYSTYESTESTTDEYEEQQDESAELIFCLSGIMGNCGTEIIFKSDRGVLRYNPNGTSLRGSDLERRVLSLVSYDQSTGKLILEVKKSGETTGTLEGVYINGTYSGKFRNVSGATSSFSFN